MQQATLTFYRPGTGMPLSVPLLGHRLAAGFPSPADDYLEGRIDLNELLIENPPATFIARVSGDSMKEAGIFDGDYVVVNRAAEWRDGTIVVARIHDEFTLKRIRKVGGRTFLMAENPDFPTIEPGDDGDNEIFGCVTGSFRRF